MLKSFLLLLRFFLFWLIFFFLERLVFLIYFSKKLGNIQYSDIATSFLYGLRLDASMAGYISLLPLLIFIFLWIFPGITFKASITKAYVYFLVVLMSLITVINFNIYREWGSKINAKALDFFFHSTSEAIASSSSSPIFLSLVILILLILSGIILARTIIGFKIPRYPVPAWQKVAAGIVFFAFTFLAIRGGVDASPINQSMAYYSDQPVLNHAAINTEWNLIQDLMYQNFSNKNPYKYFPDKQAAAIVNELYQPEAYGKSVAILSNRRPNVVLILLESFTADVIESLGGEKGVAPNMEKLISQGLFFDHIYASGDRTDKGLVAVLSAFPSQATRSILKFNDKQEKLPAISQSLKDNEYQISFYYGGQSEFFNIKSYLFSHGFNTVTDKSNFPKENMSSWGAFDHKVLEKNVSDLDKSKQPFFSTILSLSNHEPFQLPGAPHFPGESSEDKFRSTSFYTDSSVAAYLRQARSKSWYKNTLFIIVADHGHRLPKSIYEIYDQGRFRIPLIFFGEVIKPEFRGKVIGKVGNQTDIAATLLNQLYIPHDQFKWSHDLLNPATPEFSFFSYDNGFGFANKDQTISFDNVSKKIIHRRDARNLKSDSLLVRQGKAYMQQVFQTFLNY
jgi:phosphoglycerol transferase MdoB-like AlkP superfamily enzyme